LQVARLRRVDCSSPGFDPRVVDRFDAGITIGSALHDIGCDVGPGQPSTQGAVEKAVLALLRDETGAAEQTRGAAA
jgi:hypothetical protein